MQLVIPMNSRPSHRTVFKDLATYDHPCGWPYVVRPDHQGPRADNPKPTSYNEATTSLSATLAETVSWTSYVAG